MAVTPQGSGYRVSRSRYLTELLTEVDRLAALTGRAPAGDRDRVAQRRLVAAARATLVLDGIPAEEIPDPADAAATIGDAVTHATSATAPAAPTGTWLHAMAGVDHPADEVTRSLELLGAHAGLAAVDLADGLTSDLAPTLAELHRRLTRGLVADGGRARTSDQAVVDSSTGRVIFFVSRPSVIADDMTRLAVWLDGTGRRDHAVIASGVLHVELLRIHPFEIANGRLARTAARLLLQARGLDPDGVAAPEHWLGKDALGYHDEVARTARRRDLTIWLERWAEAVADGLRAAARELSALPAGPPSRAERFVAMQEGADFTLADYRIGAQVSPEEANADLQLLLDAGLVRRIPGTTGLRLRSAGD